MNSEAEATAFVVRFPIAATDAPRLTDGLSEALAGEAAAAAFQANDGGWWIELHFGHPPVRDEIAALVRAWAGDEAAQHLAYETVGSRDWVAASLAGLKPVHAGRFVVHGAHDRDRVACNELRIEIEAALAFGTGHHATTRGCLLAIDSLAKVWKPAAGCARRVLDVGTGTGVLAIAARKSLPCRVLASDIDPVSVRVARANARLNRGSDIRFVVAAGLGAPAFVAAEPFDLVLANILLDPLKRIAAPMARLVRRGATVVLSGLLANQANAALAAYRPHGFVLMRRIALEGWATLILRHAGCKKHDRPGRRSGAKKTTRRSKIRAG